jgi:hypothetical protein
MSQGAYSPATVRRVTAIYPADMRAEVATTLSSVPPARSFLGRVSELGDVACQGARLRTALTATATPGRMVSAAAAVGLTGMTTLVLLAALASGRVGAYLGISALRLHDGEPMGRFGPFAGVHPLVTLMWVAGCAIAVLPVRAIALRLWATSAAVVTVTIQLVSPPSGRPPGLLALALVLVAALVLLSPAHGPSSRPVDHRLVWGLLPLVSGSTTLAALATHIDAWRNASHVPYAASRLILELPAGVLLLLTVVAVAGIRSRTTLGRAWCGGAIVAAVPYLLVARGLGGFSEVWRSPHLWAFFGGAAVIGLIVSLSMTSIASSALGARARTR